MSQKNSVVELSPEQAEMALRRALSIQPDDAYVKDALAFVLARKLDTGKMALQASSNTLMGQLAFPNTVGRKAPGRA